jgi:hypothetical protein
MASTTSHVSNLKTKPPNFRKSKNTLPRLSMWEIHFNYEFHHYSLLTMARTEIGARILMESDWNMMPRNDPDFGTGGFQESRTDGKDIRIHNIQGPYTSGVDELVNVEEEIVAEKKWTDAAVEDKGFTSEEVKKFLFGDYGESPKFVCKCRDANGKNVSRYFFTISGVIRHASIRRIEQRTLLVSSLDG